MYIGELSDKTGVSEAKIRNWYAADLLPPLKDANGSWLNFPPGYDCFVLAVEALYRSGAETNEVKSIMRQFRDEKKVMLTRGQDIALALERLAMHQEALSACVRALNRMLIDSMRPPTVNPSPPANESVPQAIGVLRKLGLHLLELFARSRRQRRATG